MFSRSMEVNSCEHLGWSDQERLGQWELENLRRVGLRATEYRVTIVGARRTATEQVVLVTAAEDLVTTTTADDHIAARSTERMGRLNSLIDSADATLSVARGTLSTADDLVEGDARETLAELRAASRRFSAFGEDLQALVAENREGLSAFTTDGLLELTRFLEEARVLIASASRLVEDLQSNPTHFLFGDQQGGFETE